MIARGASGLGRTKLQRAQGDAITTMARNSAAQADTEDIKNARVTLQQEIAAERASGGDTDALLRTRASSGVHSSAERSAAMHELASNGRDEVIRSLMSDSNIDQNALQSAITSNAGSLIAKAPDIVKGGNAAAFTNVTGNDITKFSAGTAKQHIQYLESLHTAAVAAGGVGPEQDTYNKAAESFNSALEDIVNNTSLQGEFKGDIGKRIQQTVTDSNNPAFASTLHRLSVIQNDGKIRPEVPKPTKTNEQPTNPQNE